MGEQSFWYQHFRLISGLDSVTSAMSETGWFCLILRRFSAILGSTILDSRQFFAFGNQS